MLNNKGQIGETLTWIIATILIIVILMFFIFGASMLGETKKLSNKFKRSFTSTEISEEFDPFLKKSLFSFVILTEENEKNIIDRRLKLLEKEERLGLDLNLTRKEISTRYTRI